MNLPGQLHECASCNFDSASELLQGTAEIITRRELAVAMLGPMWPMKKQQQAMRGTFTSIVETKIGFWPLF